MQDVMLFDETVMENIRLGRGDATDEEVMAAARAAQCEEFIQRLPQGYQTNIGENGSALSGGERRILESYLILRSPTQFVMLDEPFSQVAPLHVSTLKALIRQEKSSKGILLTDHMHRHVTDIADRLYVLADGQTHLIRGGEDLVRYGYLAHL